MRAAILTIAAITATLIPTAHSQTTCQQVGNNVMCSDGTILYGAPSFAQPMSQQGFAFGNGVSTGAGVLESFKRQDLLVEQTRRLELENELLERQIQALRKDGKPGF